LLAQAYEIAAKASLDMDDFAAVLEYGRKSLRLWPENPLLLVPMANVQAQLHLLDAAARSASDALWFLDRFDRPSSVSQKEWPSLENALRASSCFVLGRVAASRAFASNGDSRQVLLTDAEQTLTKSFALNSGDPEVTFLLGLVQLGLKKPESAGAYFAETYRSSSPLQPQAASQLRALYNRSHSAAGSFEEFVSSLRLPAGSSEMPRSAVGAFPEYAGSEACKQCHASQYASWKRTGMGRMFREYRPENAFGDFSSEKPFVEENDKGSIRPILDHGKHFFEVLGPDNRWIRYPVNYTIGSKWQQAYATRLDTGQIQVFPIQYNALAKRWVNYWRLIDSAGSERAQIDKFSSNVPSATYQFNCAPCHTSQLRFRGGVLKPQNAEFSEAGINCEMCHGPSGAHATMMRSAGQYKKASDAPPVDFKRISADRYAAICGQCHLQSAVREPASDGTVNFSRSGTNFYRVLLSRPYVDFSRKAFYKDGRFRVTTFIVESFLRSQCFRKGEASCGSCHNPHPSGPSSNPVSLKFRDNPDEMCLQCHSIFKAQRAAHTRHAPSSEGSRCVSCHMPKITEAVLFSARSHKIDDIPDVEMTERFGRQESPNACLLCHENRDEAWLHRQLQAWQH
jgi:predicted CXXCH cytochrome family protein